jgi:hypothetical protein
MIADVIPMRNEVNRFPEVFEAGNKERDVKCRYRTRWKSLRMAALGKLVEMMGLNPAGKADVVTTHEYNVVNQQMVAATMTGLAVKRTRKW